MLHVCPLVCANMDKTGIPPSRCYFIVPQGTFKSRFVDTGLDKLQPHNLLFFDQLLQCHWGSQLTWLYPVKNPSLCNQSSAALSGGLAIRGLDLFQ